MTSQLQTGTAVFGFFGISQCCTEPKYWYLLLLDYPEFGIINFLRLINLPLFDNVVWHYSCDKTRIYVTLYHIRVYIHAQYTHTQYTHYVSTGGYKYLVPTQVQQLVLFPQEFKMSS